MLLLHIKSSVKQRITIETELQLFIHFKAAIVPMYLSHTVHRRLADDCSTSQKDLTKTGTDWCISLKTEHLLKCDYAALSRFCTRKPFSFKCDNAVPAALGLRPS